MMPNRVEMEGGFISKLTDAFQTTIPAGIRNLMKLSKGDMISYRLLTDGSVLIEKHIKAPEGGNDPALRGFLTLLADDIAKRPGAITPLSESMMSRMDELTAGVAVDLNGVLSPDDE